MQWICGIALFLVFSGILLEMIADTKYYKFARWVAGTILLLQFMSPLTDTESIGKQFVAMFTSFDYALGTERVLEELYQTDGQTKETVLQKYKEKVAEQIGGLLKKNGLRLTRMELSMEKDGTWMKLEIYAVYADKPENAEVLIPTIAPVTIGETSKKNVVSPMELYVRELLAEFYQIDENKIEVVIQEAE